MTKVAALTGVAALAHHVEEPAGRQRRILLQGLRDEVAVRLEQTPAKRDTRGCGALLVQDPAHGVAVHVQLGRDGPHAPMLDFVQTPDPCGQVMGNGHAARPGRHRDRAANPAARGAVERNRSTDTVALPMPLSLTTPARYPKLNR